MIEIDISQTLNKQRINKDDITSNSSFFARIYQKCPEIGSIAPDSQACVKVLLKFIPFERAEVIIEFGGASGAVTRETVLWNGPPAFIYTCIMSKLY